MGGRLPHLVERPEGNVVREQRARRRREQTPYSFVDNSNHVIGLKINLGIKKHDHSGGFYWGQKQIFT